jgi:hypothetical protein
MPTLTLPTLIRTTLTARRHLAPAVPVRVPARVPARTGPTDRMAGTPLPAAVDPDRAPSGGPQVQGDVIVLPWLDFMSPHIRSLHTASSAPVPVAGLTVLAPHILLAEYGRVFWSWWPDAGPTLGTLVVPDGMVARLAHDEHADLRIASGVYAVRRQHRHSPSPARMAWVED